MGICKNISALANTNGGHLIIRVQESSERAKIIGVETVGKAIQKMLEIIDWI